MGIRMPVRLNSVQILMVALHGTRRYLTIDEQDIIDRWAGIIIEEIAANWPVDTGLSSGSFVWVVVDDLKTGFGFDIINEVPYVQYVHWAGTPSEPPLWQTLIPLVIHEHANALLTELSAAIRRNEALGAEFFGPYEGRRVLAFQPGAR